ncbi:hypothetical protein [Comamonas testosteroni]|uniref:hypothetical protein n=1 Tax=Comamonas testosteroni TaxID=285 RepID=UPI0026ED9107|nr:hypothetical protein [Comamonas testosteroni]
MSKTQLARGIWASFAPTEDPFAVQNGMEANLRLIDDHLALYTLAGPVPPTTALPTDARLGAGQIYDDGAYAVLNAGAWQTYPARMGLRAFELLSNIEYVNIGTGWQVIAQKTEKFYLTRALMQADTGQLVGTQGVVTNDPGHTLEAPINGGYTWTGLAWVRNGFQPVNQFDFDRLDALHVNAKKSYPLQARVRDGVTSIAHYAWSALLLDVVVRNARPGKLYQVSYYQNGAVIGVPGWGWVIREFDEVTFATASGAGRIIVNYNDKASAKIDRDGGIQVIRLMSTDGVEIDLTVDPAGLLPEGSPINSNSGTGLAGWSWVVHPNRYVLAEPAMHQARRNDVRSEKNDFLTKALVRVEVFGARPGKVYGIRHFKNGTTALVGPQDGWIIEEQDAATYEANATALTVVNFTDPAPDIVRAGVQTITVVSQVVAGLQFVITIDTAQLPAFGTFVAMNGVANPGYSWVINPARYVVWPDAVGARMSWRTTAARIILVTWQSADRWYRIEIGPNGKNNLPNIRQLWTASRTGRAAGAWTLLWSGSTDWLPPLRCWAVNGGVELPAGRIFTGGNHGSDGGSGGDMTAANVMWDCVIDGAPATWGDASGNAERITLRIVNDVRAANTIATTPPRYVLREHFVVSIAAAGLGLTGERVALEGINVLTDYGVQATTNGFQQSMLFIGGEDQSWVAYTAGKSSGAKVVSPDAWACILKSENGELALWQDRGYKDSDGKFVNDDWPIMKESGSKIYGGIVGRADLNQLPLPATFAAGERWAWRGGWSIQAPGLAPVGMDAVMQLQRPGGGAALMTDAKKWSIF